MAKKMKLENERADLLMATRNDCDALYVALKAWNETSGEELRELDDWWVGLSDRSKDKLIEANQKDWDYQIGALVQGAGLCNEAFIAAME